MEQPPVDKIVSIYQRSFFEPILKDLQVSPFMRLKALEKSEDPSVKPELENIPVDLGELTVSDTLYCSYCCVGFLDKAQQRNHYKLDWHRYNLKQHAAQKKSVTEEKFGQMAGEDDVSSISGSDSESDSESDQTGTEQKENENERLCHLITRRSRILFSASDGRVVSVHRSLLLNRREEMPTDEHLIQMFKRMPWKSTWLIIMLGGGHFAAAIFKDGEAVVHKTFHSYTVRAKQGGTQSSKDGKGGHPKSAGASLRRYNEQSLTQHIQDIVKTWGPDIIKCDLIFYRAIGRSNQSILFSGSNAPLLRVDPRVRSVPFTTRRPTFNEVKRVHSLLTTVFVYDSDDKFRTSFSPPKKPREKEAPREKSPKKIDRAKERPSPVRQLPSFVQELADRATSESSIEMEFRDEEINFSDLREFEDTVPEEVKQAVRQKNRKRKKEAPKEDPMTPGQIEFWKGIHGACESGQMDELKKTLDGRNRLVSEEEAKEILNQRNIEGLTVLHQVSSEAKGDLIRLLLLHGCDPCIKDKKSRTPYDLCPDKGARNVYRRFMGEFPDLHDYTKSHIPSPLTDEAEAVIQEKRREAKQRKKQKEKERRAVSEAQRQEDEEKKRFLALSDREKRALAAERRMLSVPGQKNVILARCFLCAEDMTGKVPFEYETFRFCSIACLKGHRMKSTTKVS